MKTKKTLKIVLIMILILVVFTGACMCLMFSREFKIISSIEKREEPHPFYVMDFEDDYYFDEVFSNNISSDSELADVLSGYISHGFYKPGNTSGSHIGCSTLACVNEDGKLVWGRNFDWYEGVSIVVRATPKDGYASISTCEFSNITGDPTNTPEGIANSFLAIASYYVPMDGVNEKGLCVAQLEVNEGGQELVDTGKNNITVTMATRMLLDKAATVDEAITLLKGYDICPSGGISSHLSIADASGKSVVVEFMNGEIVVMDTPVVTNFNIANGDITAGGESAMKRYETLMNAYERCNGIQQTENVAKDMEAASQKEGKWKTRWTVVYEYTGGDSEDLAVTYYWSGDFENGTRICLPKCNKGFLRGNYKFPK